MNAFTAMPPPYFAHSWSSWRKLLLAVCSLSALIACFLVLSPPQPDYHWSLKVSMASILCLGSFFILSWFLFKTPYLFTSAYLLALSLFHLGITVPESFGLMQVRGWQSGYLLKWLEQAGWYTVLALACIGAGFSLAISPSRLAKLHMPVDPITKRHALSLAFSDGVGLLLVSGVMFGLAIASFGNLLSYSRVEFFRGVGDTRGLGVFLMIFPSAITLLMIGAQTRFEKLFAWALFFLGTALIMLSGYRTSALYPMLIGAVVWVKVGRRIPWVYAATAVMVIVIAISAVGILRAHKYQEMDVGRLESSVESASVDDTLKTLGQTGALLAHVLRLVPDIDPYRYGATYIQYVAASIPNVSTDMVESGRSAALRESRRDPKAIARSVPSDWLTYRLSPEKFALGEGVGFTGIGEPYLNFGLPGVIIFFLVLGYLLGSLDQINLLEHPELLIFSAAMLWHLVQTVRDNFGNFIKPVIFTYIILFVWRRFLAMRPVNRR